VTIYRWPIAACWIIFILFWAISAVGAKKSIGGPRLGPQVGLRIAIVVVILLALRVPIFGHAVRHARAYMVTTDPRLGALGVTLCALGVGLAIWARIYLGRNWGLPMSRKERPELVTTGPYAFIRHPIYSGMILAALGSAVAETIFWLVPLVVAGAYFIYSARSEERIMAQEFPDQYPAYQKRTKMLVPFLL
jgi:protein-S-isoprenylcysteine O-methyltransferase Ste14